MYGRIPWYFASLLFLAITSFHPTYISVINSAPWTHHYHALAAGTTLILMGLQSVLALTHRHEWHKVLGRLSLIVAVLFVHSGILSIHSVLNSHNPVLQKLAIVLTLSDFLSLSCFTLLFYLALCNRHNTAFHTRCWIAISLLFITPILSRVLSFWTPGLIAHTFDQLKLNFSLAQAVALSLGLLILIRDVRRRQDATPYFIVTIVLMTQLTTATIIGPNSAWQGLAHSFAALPQSGVFLWGGALVLLPTLWCYYWLMSWR